MTLSEVSSRLTPPEGWSEWIETKPHTEWVTRRTEPKEHIRITRHDDTFAVSVMTSEEMYHGPWTAARDLPAAYLRALTAVGLAPDTEKEALHAEVSALRRTVRQCPTCDGGGIMVAVVGVTAPDGEEIIEDATCAECHGTGVSSWGEALDEAERLKVEVAALRHRLTWTSEMPTEPGVYVAGRGVKPYDGAIMFRRWDEDGGKMERPWVDAFGLPRTDEQMKGRRFFALDNLKETP